MTASGPISLSDWQGGFTDEFVTALPCPGTHDSCATGPFDLKGSSASAGSSALLIRAVYPDWIKAVTGVGSAWFGGLVGLFVGLSASALADKIIEDVSQTQTLHIPAQLACGYRAFDLRVGYWPTKKGDASGRVRAFSHSELIGSVSRSVHVPRQCVEPCVAALTLDIEVPIFEKGTKSYLRLDCASACRSGIS